MSTLIPNVRVPQSVMRDSNPQQYKYNPCRSRQIRFHIPKMTCFVDCFLNSTPVWHYCLRPETTKLSNGGCLL